jgi:hypothetical protein
MRSFVICVFVCLPPLIFVEKRLMISYFCLYISTKNFFSFYMFLLVQIRISCFIVFLFVIWNLLVEFWVTRGASVYPQLARYEALTAWKRELGPLQLPPFCTFVSAIAGYCWLVIYSFYWQLVEVAMTETQTQLETSSLTKSTEYSKNIIDEDKHSTSNLAY